MCDRASAGLLGRISWSMIAPFLVSRVDSENRVDNWIREISPWASKTVGLITRLLTGRTGSSLSAFQGGRNFFFFWSVVPLPWCLTGEPPAGRHTWSVWGQNSSFILCSVGFVPVTLESRYEENSSSQLKMGRETVYCGLWYVHSRSSQFSFAFATIRVVNPE